MKRATARGDGEIGLSRKVKNQDISRKPIYLLEQTKLLWLPGNVFSDACQNQTPPSWHTLQSSGRRSLELHPNLKNKIFKRAHCLSYPLSHKIPESFCVIPELVPLQWDTNWNPAHHSQQEQWATPTFRNSFASLLLTNLTKQLKNEIKTWSTREQQPKQPQLSVCGNYGADNPRKQHCLWQTDRATL